jgi:hypothetical protein
MVLADTLTPAGKYYASTKPAQAFNRRYEVIPTFVFANPTLSITPGDKKVTLTISDPNLEYYDGYILEKKTDNGSYVQLAQKFGTTEKIYTDTIDFTVASKVRYRVKTRLMDGTYTGYSNETGWDATNGNDTIQYGVVALSDKSWSTVLFRSPYAAVPVIITGSPTINNSTILMTPRTKLVNLRTHFNLQLAPWQYQTNTTFIRDENLPFAVFESGKSFDFNGLKAQTARVSVGSSWVNITFPTAFDTIPVVLQDDVISFFGSSRVGKILNTATQEVKERLLGPGPSTNVRFRVHAADLPQRQLEVQPRFTNGPQRTIPFGAIYATTVIDVIESDQYDMRRFFDEWMGIISGQIQRTSLLATIFIQNVIRHPI